MPTRWWWLRHAPVTAAAGCIYGQADVDCDTSDAATFAVLGRILPKDPVFIVTPLRRTRATLDAIAASCGTPAPSLIEPAFSEQNFGRWQGLNWAQMQATDPQIYAHFWDDPTRRAPPEGESFVQLMHRTASAIDRLTAHYPGRDIVAVAHGGTIRSAVAHALALPPETAMAIVVDTLSITRLDHVADGLLRGQGGVWCVQGINQPVRWIP